MDTLPMMGCLYAALLMVGLIFKQSLSKVFHPVLFPNHHYFQFRKVTKSTAVKNNTEVLHDKIFVGAQKLLTE